MPNSLRRPAECRLYSIGGMKMIFEKGYTFTKVKTSHGPAMYVSRFGQVVKVIPRAQK